MAHIVILGAGTGGTRAAYEMRQRARLAKAAFEKYYLRKMKAGNPEPLYETYVLKALGIRKLK